MIDKLELAKSLLLKMVEKNHEFDICLPFTIAKEFEKEAISQVLCIPEHCPSCGNKITFADLSTQGAPQFRAICPCGKASGSSQHEAAINLYEAKNA